MIPRQQAASRASRTRVTLFRSIAVLFPCPWMALLLTSCVSTESAPLLMADAAAAKAEQDDLDSSGESLGEDDPLGPTGPELAAGGIGTPPEAQGLGGAAGMEGETPPASVIDPSRPVKLPLPDKPVLFAVRKFLVQYRDAWKGTGGPFREYKVIFRAYAAVDPQGDEDLAALKGRLSENFVRTHWAFVAGVHELLDFLTNRSKDMLLMDKEKNFLARIRVLSFLAAEIDASVGNGTKRYQDWTRLLYADVSSRHFGRKVRSRTGSAPPEEAQ